MTAPNTKAAVFADNGFIITRMLMNAYKDAILSAGFTIDIKGVYVYILIIKSSKRFKSMNWTWQRTNLNNLSFFLETTFRWGIHASTAHITTKSWSIIGNLSRFRIVVWCWESRHVSPRNIWLSRYNGSFWLLLANPSPWQPLSCFFRFPMLQNSYRKSIVLLQVCATIQSCTICCSILNNQSRQSVTLFW